MTNSILVIVLLNVFIILPAYSQNWDGILKAVASDRSADDQFGVSVDISGDYAIIGANFEEEDTAGLNSQNFAGSAYIFRNILGTWTQVQKIVSSDRGPFDEFGYSVAISGDYAIVGARFEGGPAQSTAGSAYIFKNNAGVWSEIQKIVASDRTTDDRFGESVDISGDYAIVGAWSEGEDALGGNSLFNAGSAYIFRNIGGTWNQVQKIVASDRGVGDAFGQSVAISGNYSIVGARWEDEDTLGSNTLSAAGAAYIFQNSSGIWNQVDKIVASDRAGSAQFGWSVAISGNYAILGAPGENKDTTGSNSINSAGAAYIFQNTGGTWSEIQKIVASDRGAVDRFGSSVAISGDSAIVGTWLEDEDASGGNTLSEAGSAYIFLNSSGTWNEVQKIVSCDRAVEDRFGSSVTISGGVVIVGSFWEDEDSSGGNAQSKAGSAYFFKECFNTSSSQTETACDTFLWGVNGQTYSSTGSYIDTLQNCNSCDSIITLILTINHSTSGNSSAEICNGDSFIFGTQTLTTSGTYTEVFQSSEGCDSTVSLVLNVTVVDTSVSISNDTLTANASGATYQWLDCNNGNSPISGETAQSFIPAQSGSYAVVVSENNCTDTSACFNVEIIGLKEDISSRILLYPNPAMDRLFIEYPNDLQILKAKVISITGADIIELDLSELTKGVSIRSLRAGVYRLIIEGNDFRNELSFVKE